MPKLSYMVQSAPTGYNSASSPQEVPSSRARRIRNFLADRQGLLRASLRLTTLRQFSSPVDGVSYWYGATAADDRLLVVSGGALYVGQPEGLGDRVPQWTFTSGGGGFAVGKAVRSAYFGTETFFVQEGGIQPLRYDGAGLYQLGISAPALAPVALPGTPSGGASTRKTGTIQYSYSLFDRRFREGDRSPAASINYASNAGKCGFVSVQYGIDPQVYGAYVYATTAGATQAYRIGTLYKHLAQTIFEDNLADTTVSTGTAAGQPGQYAIPNRASCIALHKRRLFMDDVTTLGTLQACGADAPTVWSSVTYVQTDGVRLQLGTHQGGGITALQPFGSLLGIWLRNGFGQLYGDQPNQFIFRPLHGKGCIAPSSAVWCDNAQVALMEDGYLWALSDSDGFLIKRIDADIDPDLVAASQSEREAAAACYSDSRYMVSIGDTLYLYDFGSGGWVSAQWQEVNAPPSRFNALVSVNQRQGRPLIYASRSDNNTVCALDMAATDAPLAHGQYFSRPLQGRDSERRKQAKRFVQHGSCQAGTQASATLRVIMDRGRTLTYFLRGPYNGAQNILFYQELPSAATTANEVLFELDDIAGTGVVLEKQRLEYTELG